MTQVNEYGGIEKIDITIFPIRIVCKEPGCLSWRYVRSQDKHHVKMCKFHARKNTLSKRAQRARLYRAKSDE